MVLRYDWRFTSQTGLMSLVSILLLSRFSGRALSTLELFAYLAFPLTSASFSSISRQKRWVALKFFVFVLQLMASYDRVKKALIFDDMKLYHTLNSFSMFQLRTDYHLLLVNLVITDLCISVIGIPFNTITSWR